MSYLIDTNIFIFALKDPGRAVAQRLASVSFRDRVLSSVVEAELYHGAEKYGKAQECRELLREYLTTPAAFENMRMRVPPVRVVSVVGGAGFKGTGCLQTNRRDACAPDLKSQVLFHETSPFPRFPALSCGL